MSGQQNQESRFQGPDYEREQRRDPRADPRDASRDEPRAGPGESGRDDPRSDPRMNERDQRDYRDVANEASRNYDYQNKTNYYDRDRDIKPSSYDNARDRNRISGGMNSQNMSTVSNVSAIQKELKPNKIVNKGNSVFSNHHKVLNRPDG